MCKLYFKNAKLKLCFIPDPSLFQLAQDIVCQYLISFFFRLYPRRSHIFAIKNNAICLVFLVF